MRIATARKPLLLIALAVWPAAALAKSADSIFGDWVVTGYRLAGVSAMDEKVATAWIGRSAAFDSSLARIDAARCPSPRYDSRARASEDYFAAYKTSGASFGVARDSVTVVSITCGGHPWDEPGAEVVVIGKGKLLIPWDGAFFFLQKHGRKTPPKAR